MIHEQTDIAALRMALAQAERDRDAALAEVAATHRRSQDEHLAEQHRLRNLFSVIRAVARRTADDVETVDEYCGVLDGRLAAYLNSHATMMQNWHKGADLALLLAGILYPFGLKEGERVDFVGPSILLTHKAAGILALAFHELAIGTVVTDRSGAASGNVRILWHLAGKGTARSLAIDWIDPAPTHTEEPSSSWAEWVEKAVQYQLSGTIASETSALCRITRIRLPGSALFRSGR